MMIFDQETMDFRMPESDTDDEPSTPVKRKGGRPPAHNNKKLKRTRPSPRRSPRKNTTRRATHSRIKQR